MSRDSSPAPVVSVTSELEVATLNRHVNLLQRIASALQTPAVPRRDRLSWVAEALLAVVPGASPLRAEILLGDESYVSGAEGTLMDPLTASIRMADEPVGELRLGRVAQEISGPVGSLSDQRLLDTVASLVGLSLAAEPASPGPRRSDRPNRGTPSPFDGEEMRAVLAAVPDLVLHLRTDGTVLSCQPARDSAALSSLQCHPVTGPKSCPPPRLLSECLAVGRRAVSQAHTSIAEMDQPIGDSLLALELRATPMGTDEFVVFIRDITDRRRLELELSKALEKERQLSELKTRFIAVTSHEFRTPMATIMGSVELLANHLDRLAPKKRDEIFKRILGSIHRMTAMLEDVLTLNRVDSNRMTVNLAPLDLHTLVPNVLEEIRLGDPGEHQFQFVCPAETPALMTDASLFHHVFSNLLSNAVRYSPPGSRITIAAAVEPSTQQFQIAVQDEGIGVPAADRERIFEPFERGSNAGGVQGTGLGLNIVRRIMEALGGTVSLDETAGTGSRFVLCFPVQ